MCVPRSLRTRLTRRNGHGRSQGDGLWLPRGSWLSAHHQRVPTPRPGRLPRRARQKQATPRKQAHGERQTSAGLELERRPMDVACRVHDYLRGFVCTPRERRRQAFDPSFLRTTERAVPGLSASDGVPADHSSRERAAYAGNRENRRCCGAAGIVAGPDGNIVVPSRRDDIAAFGPAAIVRSSSAPGRGVPGPRRSVRVAA